MGLFKKIVKGVTQPIINNHRGKVGEKKVDKQLNPLLFGRVEHRQINDLFLIDKFGKSHQIDHIEIRENGIFCIETKNYIGVLSGNVNDNEWCKNLYNGKKEYFANPLKQNRAHINQISNVLGQRYKINSLVVMAGNNADTLNIPNVINLDDLKEYLKKYNDGTHYSSTEMDYIYNKIMSAGADITHREHVKNIKKTQKDIARGICPRCGGKLVEVQGQYGVFIGCSNFPKCRFKKNNN